MTFGVGAAVAALAVRNAGARPQSELRITGAPCGASQYLKPVSLPGALLPRLLACGICTEFSANLNSLQVVALAGVVHRPDIVNEP